LTVHLQQSLPINFLQVSKAVSLNSFKLLVITPLCAVLGLRVWILDQQ